MTTTSAPDPWEEDETDESMIYTPESALDPAAEIFELPDEPPTPTPTSLTPAAEPQNPPADPTDPPFGHPLPMPPKQPGSPPPGAPVRHPYPERTVGELVREQMSAQKKTPKAPVRPAATTPPSPAAASPATLPSSETTPPPPAPAAAAPPPAPQPTAPRPPASPPPPAPEPQTSPNPPQPQPAETRLSALIETLEHTTLSRIEALSQAAHALLDELQHQTRHPDPTTTPAPEEPTEPDAAQAAARAATQAAAHLESTLKQMDDTMNTIRVDIDALKSDVPTLRASFEKTNTFAMELLAALNKESKMQQDAANTALRTASEGMKSAERTLKTQVQSVRWRFQLQAGMLAIGATALLVMLLSWYRPGWSLTPAQHEALRVGQDVIQQYVEADETRRAQIRDMMNWRPR